MSIVKKKQYFSYLRGESNPWWWEKNTINQMQQFAGLFPATQEKIEQFCELMLNSNILVLSKSSFSYNAAILSTNKKICPPGFWHSYSDSPNYILADVHGNFKL